jgi:PAS domain S-box-containing protein
MKTSTQSDAAVVRQKAEELLKKRKGATPKEPPADADMLNLIHELEVHQIELELQNEELELATMRAEVAKTKYFELYNFAPTGYFTLTKEGEIIDLNLYGSQMLGKERSGLRNSRFAFFVSNDSKPHFNLFLEKVFNCHTKETCEISLIAEGNSPIYVNLNGIVSENENQCFVTVVDITDHKHAEEKLQANDILLKKLNADKDRFISILAHDLRSSFSALLGFSGLLKENLRIYKMNEIETNVNNINLSAQNTFNLLEDILVWAQTQSGKIPYQPKKLSFGDICNKVLENMKPSADAKKITINYYTTAEVNVFADSDMLKTILRNLISNAIKFTNREGHVNIYTINSPENITISVSDNGIGIPPYMASKLFDISQNHTTNGTANETGTGLGLMLCKEFVEKHGGKIWIESKEGKGSDFKFSLPNEHIKMCL